jgi:hypothetical protein
MLRLNSSQQPVDSAHPPRGDSVNPHKPTHSEHQLPTPLALNRQEEGCLAEQHLLGQPDSARVQEGLVNRQIQEVDCLDNHSNSSNPLLQVSDSPAPEVDSLDNPHKLSLLLEEACLGIPRLALELNPLSRKLVLPIRLDRSDSRNPPRLALALHQVDLVRHRVHSVNSPLPAPPHLSAALGKRSRISSSRRLLEEGSLEVEDLVSPREQALESC